MYEIVLAIAKREKVVSVQEIIRKTGLKRSEVLIALNFWSSRGKLSYKDTKKEGNFSCKGCILMKYCKRGGDKKWRIH